MTGNKFAGEICVYCNVSPSTTDDHVFARKFFLTGRRDNLPQVPACEKCNGEKARIEAELMSILPFGGRHADAGENLRGQVPKRLAKNAKIAGRLRSGQSRPWVKEAGILRQGVAVPLDWRRVEELSVYMAKGIAWHEWKIRFGVEQFVSAHVMVGHQGAVLRQIHRLNAAKRVDVSLGDGTFRYAGAQAGDNPHITVWEFTLYGGLRSELSGDGPCNIGVLTGPTTIHQRAATKGQLLSQWRAGTRLHT